MMSPASSRFVFPILFSAWVTSAEHGWVIPGERRSLSQSELAVTFGLGRHDRVDRVVIAWPSGRTDEYRDLPAGRTYEVVEGQGIRPATGF
jgi:hypothetical protein